MIDTLQILALIRALAYLYLTTEAFLIAYLYWNAYRNYKMTQIIKSVYLLILTIGWVFFYMTIIGLISFIDRSNDLYDVMISLLPLVVFPLIFSLRNFRLRSTEGVKTDGHKDGKKLIKHYNFKK